MLSHAAGIISFACLAPHHYRPVRTMGKPLFIAKHHPIKIMVIAAFGVVEGKST